MILCKWIVLSTRSWHKRGSWGRTLWRCRWRWRCHITTLHACMQVNEHTINRNNYFKVKVVSAIITPWGWLHSSGQRNSSHPLDLLCRKEVTSDPPSPIMKMEKLSMPVVSTLSEGILLRFNQTHAVPSTFASPAPGAEVDLLTCRAIKVERGWEDKSLWSLYLYHQIC